MIDCIKHDWLFYLMCIALMFVCFAAPILYGNIIDRQNAIISRKDKLIVEYEKLTKELVDFRTKIISMSPNDLRIMADNLEKYEADNLK